LSSLPVFSSTYSRPTLITSICRNHHLYNTFSETYNIPFVFNFPSPNAVHHKQKIRYFVWSNPEAEEERRARKVMTQVPFPSLSARHAQFLCYYTSRHIVIVITFTILNMTVTSPLHFFIIRFISFYLWSPYSFFIFPFDLLFIRFT
jgi:hypothetical protein